MQQTQCLHHRYTKTEVDQKWTGHATCTVLARRTCLSCDYSQDDWEFGDHEAVSGPRMLADDMNFFTGAPWGECLIGE